MAVYRPVHVSFWQDSFVLDLTPEEKYFYLYLMTNSKTSQSGIYELPLRIIETDTGYNRETVMKLLERFAEYGKINYNQKTKELFLINWLKFNPIKNVNIEKCVLKEIQSVKDQDFLVDFYETCLQLEKEQDFKIPRIKAYLSVRLEGLIRGFQDPSKEEEKEEEKEKEQQQEERTGAEEVVEVNPISFYEQNFGLITPFIADGIYAWIDDLNAELVIKAMEIALEKNTRNMSYVNTILRDWHLKGFKTVTDVEAADKAFRAQRLTKAQQQTQTPYQQKGLSESTKNVLQQQQAWEQNIPTEEELAVLSQQNAWLAK
ncbi:DnaD domain protein [Bacillus sp. AS_5]|uniref:DnaD domain-containing protein n=1 Tax=unclassified Bacillus (in: firmicutes) TaxID=185979 RepID=UPI00224985C6|nr:DnaD domain protein [Bacillus sp. AS_3]MCW4652746.1 DnaD domain protein [Bacillus sp. AS_3]MCX2699617.1 DnaD domain protein [Bacillus sp. AS_5]